MATDVDPMITAYVKSSGIFSAEPAASILSEAFRNRVEFAHSFLETMTYLTSTLKQNNKAQTAFFATLDKVRGLGLMRMVKAHTGILQYHIAEHAAEVAYDTSIVLEKVYRHKFPDPDDELLNEIFRQIAVAAAVWHDIVQDKNSPVNEIESAREFAVCMHATLNQFSHQHQPCKDAIKQLLSYMDFIANELIVYDTWLLFGSHDGSEVSVKTLRQHASLAESNGLAVHYEKNAAIMRLALAADSISVSDTSRCALEHVCENKYLVRMIAKLPDDAQEALKKFFEYAGITDLKHQQEFLGLLGQGVRIFGELSPPDKAYITCQQYAFFCDIMKKLRMEDNNITPDDYVKLLYLFMTTTVQKAHKTTIQLEIHFAKSIGKHLWLRHAHDLESLVKYYREIADNDRAPLAVAIFKLSTTYQEGLSLLRTDQTFRQLLKTELHPGPLKALLQLFRSTTKEKLLTYEQLLNR